MVYYVCILRIQFHGLNTSIKIYRFFLVPNATHTETVEGIMCKKKEFSTELVFTRDRFGSSNDANCEMIDNLKASL